MSDLELFSANFITCEIPPHKEYLHKYFKGDIQERAVVYFLTVPYDGNFQRYRQSIIDHIGVPLSPKWVADLLRKFRKIEGLMLKAEADKDHETVALIRSGKWVRRPNKGKSATRSLPDSQ